MRTEQGPLILRSGRQKVILAVLLLSEGRVAPTEQLIEAVWGGTPPPTARSQVQICISALRRTLAAALPGRTIETHAYGYTLTVRDDDLDTRVFNRTVRAGQRAAADGRLNEGIALLQEALSIWRGSALADLPGLMMHSEAARLEEKRLSAIEQRMEIGIELGLHRELIDDLAGLVAEYPLNERLNGLMMLSLYRSGRQAEALAVYRKIRKNLAEQLALQPGRGLRDLEHAILNQDESLESVSPDWLRIDFVRGRAA
ncbi:AfsR/SARP family transcriptional regulator [Streptomyces sp. NBC_00286]|uniref:AfsR/SARP family transcriptional regulator n=1 Tax=Streptomyces sp. NBC_00286 TaxID=2975701 RepID=UPI002E29469F|nr:AfsR/SARP family transcriptional regulator [Streptomyces sp. NBC_00286]